jgi:hypothetical protein
MHRNFYGKLLRKVCRESGRGVKIFFCPHEAVDFIGNRVGRQRAGWQRSG